MNIRHNGSKTGMEFAAHLGTIMRERAEAESAWRAKLFSQGVVATHPDDGWVDREENTICFAYPYINRRLEPGALVALGDHEKHRIVRLTCFKEWGLGGFGSANGDWSFEEVPNA